ncbi:hypothetical protein SK128_009899 [Halocaridina rubra]|uniref:Uncharacterized protein n=1 Tax=Halocaridina rubra TaxID=373956 RepID=A0AAN9ADL9_HALRR
MRTPWDNQWGVSQTSGNWTGTVGTLQHNKADFSMLLSWMGSRMAVVDYSRVYVSEPLVIVTAKPRELPEIFSLVRPFPKVLWVAILGTCMIAGTMIWLLQKIWGWMLGKRSLNLSTALLYSWGILLEDPPVNLPSNITARVSINITSYITTSETEHHKKARGKGYGQLNPKYKICRWIEAFDFFAKYFYLNLLKDARSENDKLHMKSPRGISASEVP